MSYTQRMPHPVFNERYEILKALGEGHTSKVYLGKLIGEEKYAAIKILREEFIRSSRDSLISFQNEIEVLQLLDHHGIVKMYEYGDQGKVVKPSGRVITNLVFVVMEFVQGGVFFDLVQSMGAMGEDAGRFFLHQMLDAVDHIHTGGVAHRDLKLENILVDDNLNLKIADFGFAKNKNINLMYSYRGTKTYMAPEIKLGKPYDGRQVDMFSIGVILFIIVQGIFPFNEARTQDYHYKFLLNNQSEQYFHKTNGSRLSDDFKDLILRFFSFDPETRVTLDQVREHPWMHSESFDYEATRNQLLTTLALKTGQAPPALTEKPASPVQFSATSRAATPRC